jgi:acyl phosphate:glycerol-3-phosphate acyltransferase
LLKGVSLLEFILKTFVAYLVGSALGSLIVGKLRGGIDIRNLGSGNAGGTNALRTQGTWFALWVMVIDVGKGWLAASLLPTIPLPFEAATLNESARAWLPLACSTGVVLGHVYPIWFGFRGGKGAATLIGVVFGLHAFAALPVLTVWICVLLLTGFVGLATILAAVAFPVYVATAVHSSQLLAFGGAMALFVLFTHRSNVSRMLAGNEHRATRVWLLRPR